MSITTDTMHNDLNDNLGLEELALCWLSTPVRHVPSDVLDFLYGKVEADYWETKYGDLQP
jgi:hypothetical protein